MGLDPGDQLAVLLDIPSDHVRRKQRRASGGICQKTLPRHAPKLAGGERLVLEIAGESRRSEKMNVIPRGIEGIGERERTDEMRHRCALRKKENPFSRHEIGRAS